MKRLSVEQLAEYRAETTNHHWQALLGHIEAVEAEAEFWRATYNHAFDDRARAEKELAESRAMRDELLGGIALLQQRLDSRVKPGGLQCGPDYESLYDLVRRAYCKLASQYRVLEDEIARLRAK